MSHGLFCVTSYCHWHLFCCWTWK